MLAAAWTKKGEMGSATAPIAEVKAGDRSSKGWKERDRSGTDKGRGRSLPASSKGGQSCRNTAPEAEAGRSKKTMADKCGKIVGGARAVIRHRFVSLAACRRHGGWGRWVGAQAVCSRVRTLSLEE